MISNWKRYGNRMRGAGRILTVLICLALTVPEAAAQCSGKALACNNLVQVSLDTNCVAKITPDVVLEGIGADAALYEVVVYDPNGDTIPNDLITQDYDGKKLEVRVYCRATRLYCWGYLKIEDKIKPSIKVTPRDTAVTCFRVSFEFDPNELLNAPPKFSDNGCLPPTLDPVRDFVKTFPCTKNKDTIQIITRLWTVRDAAGNTCTDTQYIYILKANVNELVFPRDTVIDCLDEADISVEKLGKPEVRSCTQFEIHHQDVVIPVCGVSRKILRRWTVYDICGDTTRMHTQVIKIEDKYAPVMSFGNFTIPMDRVVTDKYSCTSSIIDIPNPVITDCNLAQTTVEVFYQLLDKFGNLTGPLKKAGANKILSQPDSPTTGQIVWNLENIPVGVEFKVIFVANDGCGNISRDTSQVLVLPDKSPPNAVCEGSTTVTLNANGIAEVFAFTFDDHSYDNCGIVKREVRRFNNTCSGFNNEISFRNSVHFCCDDITRNPVKVVLRVYDAANNYSDCVVSVYVQDKRSISISCPPNRTFNCDFNLNNLKTELEKVKPQVSWVCGEKSLQVSIPPFTLSSCGIGSVTVTWTAMDRNGQMATCNQFISFVNLSPPTIIRPNLNLTLSNCTNGTSPDAINSKPVVNNVDCENIALTHSDELLIGDPAACVKILRKWAIIDWCRFNGGSLSSAVLDSFTQTIKINDTVKPLFSNCPAQTLIVEDADKNCEEFVNLLVVATDDCTAEEQLKYSYVLDLGNNGSVDRTGQSNDASDKYPVGTHKVTFTVTDKCGNFEICVINFTVKTQKAPIPICSGTYQLHLGVNGTATVLAKDLNIKSTTGCTNSEQGLTFSFDQAGTQLSKTFNCSDIPNGVQSTREVQLWVTDANGLKNSCNVTIFLSDANNNVCPDNVGNSAVSGFINDESKIGAEKIPVKAVNMRTGQTLSAQTDKSGKYSFNLLQFQDYSISPALEGFDLTGISTLDIVKIQQHILGLSLLDSPYKLLAADVNNNNSISASDLVELRKLILGYSTKLSGPSWKFVKKDFVFDDPKNPWGYASKGLVNQLEQSMSDVDFVGLKVGDVSGNAFGSLAQLLAGPRSALKLKYDVQDLSGKTIYSFYAEQDIELMGFQLMLDFGGSRIQGIYSEQIEIHPDQFRIEEGKVRISWNRNEPVRMDARALFRVEIDATRSTAKKAPVLTDELSPEVYDAYLAVQGIRLEEIRNLSERNTAFRLWQNQPNPFSDQTVISFETPNGGEAELLLHDISGKVVHQVRGNYDRGINHIEITNKDLPGPGLYYYTLTSGEFLETRRMIVLH